jgi:nitroreductase
MNSKLQPLFARRSTRRFTDQPVEEGLLRDLLEAAMAAPSAVAKDPWHFILIQNPQILARLATGMTNGRFLAQAAAGIAICGDLQRAHEGELSFLLQDCSAATENILIAATLLGLGACWLGVHPWEDRIQMVREVLHVPAGIVPVCMVAIGWPAQRTEARTRFRNNALHVEHW